MKIFFDHQIFSQQLYGGISRYFCELITGINKTENQAHLSLFHSNNTYLSEYGLSVMPYYFPKRHRLLNLTNRYYNLTDLKFNNFDIYHATYFDPFFIKHTGNKPYIVTYHDMIHEKFAHQFSTLGIDKKTVNWKKNVSKQATHLIAVSENTKKDMVNYLGIAPERIHVIYLGSSIRPKSIQSTDRIETEKPYLLYVGNRNIYKNFIPFLIAVSPVLKQYNLRLVCAGGSPFTNDEYNIIKSYGINNYVEQQPITDQSLVHLYSNAVAFMFPSLYEGFGIPILEAMACGCPCLLSNCSSMPEIAGEAALYFNPNDINDMRSALIKLLDSQAFRQALGLRGIEQASHFSWEHTVQKTLSLYESVL